MGCRHVADFYLLWIPKSCLDMAHKKVAGQLLIGCSSYDLADRDVD